MILIHSFIEESGERNLLNITLSLAVSPTICLAISGDKWHHLLYI